VPVVNCARSGAFRRTTAARRTPSKVVNLRRVGNLRRTSVNRPAKCAPERNVADRVVNYAQNINQWACALDVWGRLPPSPGDPGLQSACREFHIVRAMAS
jgi:hypothetical protein